MLETLKKNVKNKTWWVAVISALILLGQSHGLDLTKYIGTNWQDTLNTIFGLAVLLGVSVDTTAIKCSDISDSTIQVATQSVQAIQSVANASVQDTSASSKIVVDNPDNGVELNKTVSATNAAQPN